MEEKSVKMNISGHVQGVFFRANTRDKARQLDLKGWVKNLSNGDVEIFAQGSRKNLEQLKKWARKGPPRARVDEVRTQEEQTKEGLKDFKIRY